MCDHDSRRSRAAQCEDEARHPGCDRVGAFLPSRGRVGALCHPCGCQSIRVGAFLPGGSDEVPGRRRRQDAIGTHTQQKAPTRVEKGTHMNPT